MKKNLKWEAYSSQERNTIIEKIKQTINRHGYIITFNMFSDLALSLNIEIEENQIVKLYNDLQKIISLTDLDTDKLNLNSNKEWIIFMNISFSKGTGKLNHEKPMVDG